MNGNDKRGMTTDAHKEANANELDSNALDMVTGGSIPALNKPMDSERALEISKKMQEQIKKVASSGKPNPFK